MPQWFQKASVTGAAAGAAAGKLSKTIVLSTTLFPPIYEIIG